MSELMMEVLVKAILMLKLSHSLALDVNRNYQTTLTYPGDIMLGGLFPIHRSGDKGDIKNTKDVPKLPF